MYHQLKSDCQQEPIFVYHKKYNDIIDESNFFILLLLFFFFSPLLHETPQ
uniref:Uncharacterized protein n=1 Tax=Rhizophora mucronata TaxID=61149 RepID=A0A2P2QSE7_RHIMU